MRSAPKAALVVAGMMFVPRFAFAQADQSAKYFNDSWFWGVNGGAMFFTAGVDHNTTVTAPSVGGEWLITRTHIGLRLAIDQAFFNEAAGVFDPSSAGGVRQIDVSDWRRYSGEIYFFPRAYGSLRPYAGLGLALNVLRSATPTGTFTTQGQMDTLFLATNDLSSKVSTVLTAGLQANLQRAGLFVQASSMPTRNNFLLNRSSYTFMVQAGLRYNFGSAIAKDP